MSDQDSSRKLPFFAPIKDNLKFKEEEERNAHLTVKKNNIKIQEEIHSKRLIHHSKSNN